MPNLYQRTFTTLFFWTVLSLARISCPLVSHAVSCLCSKASDTQPYLLSSGSQTAGSWGIHVLLETGSESGDRGLLMGVTTRDKEVYMADTTWKNNTNDVRMISSVEAIGVCFH